jgi:putative membrane protein
MTDVLTTLAWAGDHDGWWVVAPFFWVLWLALIGTVVFLLARGRLRRMDGGDRARSILAERFARGEISTDEFRERLDALR